MLTLIIFVFLIEIIFGILGSYAVQIIKNIGSCIFILGSLVFMSVWLVLKYFAKFIANSIDKFKYKVG